jgi:hypothetical protein
LPLLHRGRYQPENGSHLVDQRLTEVSRYK